MGRTPHHARRAEIERGKHEPPPDTNGIEFEPKWVIPWSEQRADGERPPPDRSWVQTKRPYRVSLTTTQRLATLVLGALGVLCLAGVVPYPLFLTGAGLWFAVISLNTVPPTPRNPYRIEGLATPPTRAQLAEAADWDTPWRGTEHVYHFCTSCGRTPNAKLMGWDEHHRYLCQSCRTGHAKISAKMDAVWAGMSNYTIDRFFIYRQEVSAAS